MTLIRVAHSPDSDDAFMFYALAKGRMTPKVFSQSVSETVSTSGAIFLIGVGIVLLALGGFITFKGYGAQAPVANRRPTHE